MSESATHLYLVDELVDWIATSLLEGDSRGILIDSAGIASSEKPPMINNYVPDVLVTSLNCDKFIIGEAKTARDLENEHTLHQFEAFLLKCSQCSNSFFVIAVPWYMSRRAKSLLRLVTNRLHVTNVKIYVIERLHG